jgi:RNA polymerase sigma-70 factor (ECF subfamily)
MRTGDPVVAQGTDRVGERSALHRARALVGQLGEQWVDPWELGPEVLKRISEKDMSLERAARDVVSAALWSRAMDGHHGARRRLLSIWHREVHRWCRSLAGRRLDPDDLAQEVLVRALSRLERVLEPDRFHAWLYGTLLRVIRERERWARVRRFAPEALLREQPCLLPLADAALLAHERDDLVRLALAELSAEHRVLLWAHSVEGQRRHEIAAWSGLAPGTLNRRLTAARRAFEKACTRLGVIPQVVR